MERKRLTVLHVVGGGPWGGIGTYLSMLARYGVSDGVTHLLACVNYRDEWCERLLGTDVEICQLPPHRSWDVRLPGFLTRLTKEVKPDIVHTHGYKADCIASLLKARLRCPIVATAHGWTEATVRDRLYKRLDLLALRRFDQVVGVCNYTCDQVASGGVPQWKVIRVYPGVQVCASPESAPTGPVRSRPSIPGVEVLYGCVGRLSPEKGHWLLVKSFADIRARGARAHLVIVGDGSERHNLERLAGRLGVGEHVSFLGYQSNPTDLVRSFDVFVLPSLREGLPFVVLEALSMNVPVLASRVGGVPEVIQSGQIGGLLVERGNVEGLTEGMMTLYRSPVLRRTLAWRGRNLVARQFSPQSVVSEIAGIYENFVSS
jgi:glycosyltransferase involved in cell wall biosynthesis